MNKPFRFPSASSEAVGFETEKSCEECALGRYVREVSGGLKCPECGHTADSDTTEEGQ